MSQLPRDFIVYDHIWKTEPARTASKTVEKLLALLQVGFRFGTLPVLDIGCGAGRHMMAALHSGFSVVGVDHSSAAIEAARLNLASMPQKLGSGATLVMADAFSWLESMRPSTACAAICHDVIHHGCRDTEELLRRLNALERVVTSAGYLAITLLTDIRYSNSPVPIDRLNLTVENGGRVLSQALAKSQLIKGSTKAFEVRETVSIDSDGSIVTTSYSATRISRLYNIR